MSNDSYEVTIRLACQEDLRHRMELVRQGFSAHFWDAFWFFLLQELTLECCVLGAAVLFIFCGVSAAGCLLLLPAAAAVVATCVLITHEAMAQKHAQSVSNELFGVVAEVRGAPVSGAERRRALHIRYRLAPPAPAAPLAPLAERDRPEYAQVVGTVSVSELWGPREDGWLHAFAVHPEWRRRGVGRALAGGAREGGARRRLGALGAACSALQGGARGALGAAGWECAASYCRPLLGAALALPLVRLTLPLPPAPPV